MHNQMPQFHLMMLADLQIRGIWNNLQKYYEENTTVITPT